MAVNRGLSVLSRARSKEERKTVMKAMRSRIGLLFSASLFVAAQHQRDSAANRSNIVAFETRGTRRKSARRPGLSTRLDNSLVYTDYDGTENQG
jgi:hypothetical protein